MRAATTDHGQTIHLLRKTSLANSTQLPDECSVRDAMAGAGRHQTECDRAVAFARVIGNVAKGQREASGSDWCSEPIHRQVRLHRRRLPTAAAASLSKQGAVSGRCCFAPQSSCEDPPRARRAASTCAMPGRCSGLARTAAPLLFVQLSSEVGGAAGARSVTRATAPGCLLAGTTQAIGKRLRGGTVGVDVAPEFMPKRNSELVVRGGRDRR